jgi:hypothetical protein
VREWKKRTMDLSWNPKTGQYLYVPNDDIGEESQLLVVGSYKIPKMRDGKRLFWEQVYHRVLEKFKPNIVWSYWIQICSFAKEQILSRFTLSYLKTNEIDLYFWVLKSKKHILYTVFSRLDGDAKLPNSFSYLEVPNQFLTEYVQSTVPSSDCVWK